VGRQRATWGARAFAPAHLTGFFVPDATARDPRARGSLGVGLVLDRGVLADARWTSTAPPGLRLTSRPRTPLPISREVARRLRGTRSGRLAVALTHQLPIGQGLGMSAAGATATALAVGELFDLPKERAISVAHLAEYSHRGGLGGVAAIAGGGGLEWRRRPGLPPWGEVLHRPVRAQLRLGFSGAPVPTRAVLSDPVALARIRRAGRAALLRYARRPTLRRFLEESERFTDAVDLADDRLRRAIDRYRAEGWYAAQAMFGRLLFAVPRSGDPEPPRVGLRRTVRVGVGSVGAGPRPPPGPG